MLDETDSVGRAEPEAAALAVGGAERDPVAEAVGVGDAVADAVGDTVGDEVADEVRDGGAEGEGAEELVAAEEGG